MIYTPFASIPLARKASPSLQEIATLTKDQNGMEWNTFMSQS